MSRDWSKDTKEVQEFAAKFGIGPLYKPKPQPTRTCSKCGKGNAIVKERHADTDMNCMAVCCPDCGHEEEV